ncbi:14493_t:CDS:10 [Funneliformis mosseae]|uniref:14493_t:CDS:1 n=1 Tax=Funneliformis mosseae TaxID=27381 RepID=A0A9N8VGH5_FUNMO|nr:14493_t:CDS:10 [Funneliformis mosseae]
MELAKEIIHSPMLKHMKYTSVIKIEPSLSDKLRKNIKNVYEKVITFYCRENEVLGSEIPIDGLFNTRENALHIVVKANYDHDYSFIIRSSRSREKERRRISGTYAGICYGKSRLIKEYANNVYTLYLNLGIDRKCFSHPSAIAKNFINSFEKSNDLQAWFNTFLNPIIVIANMYEIRQSQRKLELIRDNAGINFEENDIYAWDKVINLIKAKIQGGGKLLIKGKDYEKRKNLTNVAILTSLYSVNIFPSVHFALNLIGEIKLIDFLNELLLNYRSILNNDNDEYNTLKNAITPKYVLEKSDLAEVNSRYLAMYWLRAHEKGFKNLEEEWGTTLRSD